MTNTEPRTLSPFAQVLADGVTDPDHMALVGLHANLIMNTTPGIRPSDAARRAVADYTRLGFDGLTHYHAQARGDALRACPCPACRADADRLTA